MKTLNASNLFAAKNANVCAVAGRTWPPSFSGDTLEMAEGTDGWVYVGHSAATEEEKKDP